MKLIKSLIVVLLIAANVTPALASVTEITSAPESILAAINYDVSDGCTLITKTLEYGMNDPEIFALGKFLKSKGYFKGKPSKQFTKGLEKALKNYQFKSGVFGSLKNANGITGGPTREQIADDSCKKSDIGTPATSCVYIARNLTTDSNALVNKNPDIKQDILALQRFLVRSGYLSSTFVTGIFSGLTKEALIRFQYDNGIIGSTTQAGAGNAGPVTREFIAKNTCGSADVSKSTTPPKIGYRVALTTRTNVEMYDADSETIFRINVTPQSQNAQVAGLDIQVDTPSGILPWNYIESVELHRGSRILLRKVVSAADRWTTADTDSYVVTLAGSGEYLTIGQENQLNVKIVPKSSALNGTVKEFEAVIPEDGLKIQFSDPSFKPRGIEEWGAPSQKSTFKIGKQPTSTSTSNTNTNTNTDTTSNTSTTTTPIDDGGMSTPGATIKAPQLNWIRPDNGDFGDALVLRGVNFHSTINQIKLVHVRTGVTRIMNNFASKNNQIHFNFPGRGAAFKRPNGTTVTPNQANLKGNYRVYVTSNGKQSNWILFKINE